MNNADEILKRVLLNMRYDSRKTLNENVNLLNEQPKPSASVGDVETVGIIPDEVKTSNNVISTVDYNGKPLIFNGSIYKTSKQFIDEMLNEVKTKNESAYRLKSIYGNTVDYVGPEWGKNLYKSYQENKLSLDDLRARFGGRYKEWVKIEKKLSGYEYTKNTLGYIATMCRSSLQSDLKNSLKDKSIRYQSEIWYGEPDGTKDCVVNSIKSIGTKLNPNSVFSFWAIDPKTNSKEYFYLGFSCGREVSTENSYSSWQQLQIDGKVNTSNVILPTKCDSSSIRFSGYKTVDGKKWDSVKKENVKYAESNLNKNSDSNKKIENPNVNVDNNIEMKGRGDKNDFKVGGAIGIEGSDGTTTSSFSFDLEL